MTSLLSRLSAATLRHLANYADRAHAEQQIAIKQAMDVVFGVVPVSYAPLR
jgi:hypothetical protein